MLHVMQFGVRPSPNGVLRAMFAARKSVFIDLLKWDVPVIDGAYELDQFDDSHASYLVLGDRHGAHLASARLLPTIRPHILDSFYAELCEADPPRAPEIYEITRFCLDRNLDARTRRAVRNTLITGLVEYALGAGISAYTATAEIAWFQQILAFGWRCQPLGLPRLIDGKMLVALRIEIEADTPARLTAAGIAPMVDLHPDARSAA